MRRQKLMEFAVERHLEGDLDAASEVYSKVLLESPEDAHVWNLSGVLAHQLGRHDEGIQYLSHAISLRKDVPGYHLNLATALLAENRSAQAIECGRQCVELDPQHKLGWNVLGKALHQQQVIPEAIQCFERAIEIDADNLDAWVSLGQIYRATNQLDLADESVTQSLRIDSQHPVALDNLGVIRHRQGRADEALSLFEKALQQQPDAPDPLVNMGNTLHDLGRYKEAEAAFLKAVQSAPLHADAWNNLGFHYAQLAQTVEAIECYRRALELSPRHALAGSNYLFALNLADVTREECFAAHSTMAELLPNQQATQFNNDRNPARKLRVGYVSPDFRRHPMIGFFEPLLMEHSSNEFEVFCYANVKKEDDVTARIQSNASHWRSIFGMSDVDVGASIIEDKIDILIDLAGHTADNRLAVFAQRAAPIQVSMLGYLNTTGLSTMDYFVTDAVRDPPSEDQFYTEEVVRLTEGGCCWSPPKNSPAVQSPPMLKQGYVTFGSMHRPNKLTDRTLKLWANVLKAVPDSRLLIFHNMLKNSEQLQGHILAGLQDDGVAIDRIDLAWNHDDEYLMAYGEMDILLETTPWSSGTTALEALWQGVPTPTLYGSSPYGRATASALKRLNLHDLVAVDEYDYTEKVVQLAGDAQRLTQLRGKLRTLMQGSLCDAKSFVRQLEDSYREMWKRACHEA